MNEADERVNKVERGANDYLAKFKLEKIISDMLNALIHIQCEKPLIFMVISSLPHR